MHLVWRWFTGWVKRRQLNQWVSWRKIPIALKIRANRRRKLALTPAYNNYRQATIASGRIIASQRLETSLLPSFFQNEYSGDAAYLMPSTR
jgi:hypothetical protein